MIKTVEVGTGVLLLSYYRNKSPTPINPLGIHSISACTGCGDSGNRMGRRKIFSKKWLGEEPTEREEIHCHGIFPGGICNRNDYVSDVYRKHCLSGRYGVRLSGPGRDCDSGDHNRKSILYTGNLQRHLRCLYNSKET